jgi:hypothetical protein
MFCVNLKKTDPTVETNHWLRDRNGKVLCQRLRETVCRNCGKKGHTIKNCRKNKHVSVSTTNMPPPPHTDISSNIFDALIEEESEYPILPIPSSPPKLVRQTNACCFIQRKTFADAVKIATPPPPRTTTAAAPIFKKNWADYDSEDE